MYYWDMWHILGIDRTTDKKAIRKAYAAKTREIHPEEKPEEFRQLHEAYRWALADADYNLRIKRIEAKTGRPYKSSYELADEYISKRAETDTAGTDEATGESGTNQAAETAGEAELISYFGEQQEKHQQSVDAFIEYWKAFQSPYRNPEVLEWWKAYLFSEEFQEIRYHPQVLHLLAEEINDKFFYAIDKVKLLFWDAYGFQEDEEDTFQGDRRRLYKSLYPAYERQQSILKNAKEAAKYDKIIRVFAGVAAAAVIAVCIFAFVTYQKQKEEGLQYLVNYMAQEYADTSFSEPECKGNGNNGSFVYVLHSEAHPELEITAQVWNRRYADGTRAFEVAEDYEKLLLEYYAPQYGIEAGRYGYGEAYYTFLLYRDAEQIDEFCENVERMFEEQEELQGVYETAIYTNEVLHPDVLLAGRVEHYSFMEPQVYDLRTMGAKELAAALKEAYMIYMFQCESWNITPAQYREWGAAYEKLCERWVSDDGEWCEVYDPETGEYLCRVFVNTYEYLDGTYDVAGTPMPVFKRAITVGNAYYYLLDRGANLETGSSGNHFKVRLFGETTTFGWNSEVEFSELRDWY